MSSFFGSDGSFVLQFLVIFLVLFGVLTAGVLVVRREAGLESRTAFVNFGREPRRLPALVGDVLLASRADAYVDGFLGPEAAIVTGGTPGSDPMSA